MKLSPNLTCHLDSSLLPFIALIVVFYTSLFDSMIDVIQITSCSFSQNIICDCVVFFRNSKGFWFYKSSFVVKKLFAWYCKNNLFFSLITKNLVFNKNLLFFTMGEFKIKKEICNENICFVSFYFVVTKIVTKINIFIGIVFVHFLCIFESI